MRTKETNDRECKKYALRKKLKCFEMFDSKCAWCGNTDHRVLQIDHIFGCEIKRGGNRRSGCTLYRAIVNKSVDIGEFQLLCSNCNWIKRYELKEHSRYKYKWQPKDILY